MQLTSFVFVASAAAAAGGGICARLSPRDAADAAGSPRRSIPSH